MQASITKSNFGTVDGKEVNLYVLTNAKGLVMKVTNYGAIVTEFHAPDRNGKLGDIVGGYENLEGYLKKTPYFGATIGRVANRITNGRFQLEGKTYQLATNDPRITCMAGKRVGTKSSGTSWQPTTRPRDRRSSSRISPKTAKRDTPAMSPRP